MNLAETFANLTPAGQRTVHLWLCDQALNVWTAFATQHAPIVYLDSVVGMRHEVEVGLPHEALQSARAGRDLADVAQRYQEPITALQDDDLSFPEPVVFAYYAVYNCFRVHACGEDLDRWMIVNQALSSDADRDAWRPRLVAAMAGVR